MRQRHFLDAVLRACSNNSLSQLGLSHICREVSQSPAPQFYIGTKQALAMYNLYRKEGRIKGKSAVTTQMYLDIFNRYEARYAEARSNDFKYTVMQEVLDSAAPSFYIEPKAALAFYYRAMAQRRLLKNIK